MLTTFKDLPDQDRTFALGYGVDATAFKRLDATQQAAVMNAITLLSRDNTLQLGPQHVDRLDRIVRRNLINVLRTAGGTQGVALPLRSAPGDMPTDGGD